jgi:acetyl-CoA C-acetyltransferase
LSKHAFGVYRTEPAATGFRCEDVQARVDSEPTTTALTSYEGAASIESFTVVHAREGKPEKGFVAARIATGERTLAVTDEADELARMTESDVAEAKVSVSADGSFRFR